MSGTEVGKLQIQSAESTQDIRVENHSETKDSSKTASEDTLNDEKLEGKQTESRSSHNLAF